MEYKCKICIKNYSSYQSLWIHNKKYHNDNVSHDKSYISHSSVNDKPNISQTSINDKSNIYSCKYCNNTYKHFQSRWKHEKSCKEKNNEIIKLKNEIEQLKSNNKTNNKIITTNSNNNNTNNGTINNVNNTFIINKIGEETVNKLSYDDIKDIFRQHKNCLYHAISYVNFNKNIPENHNFYNSSLEGKYINVFNNDKNEIEKKNKKDFFDTILLSSINITNLLYDKIKDSVSKKKQGVLKKMVDEIRNFSHINHNKKIYITNFNEISYNNKNVVKNTWNKKINNLEITENSDDDSDNESEDSDISRDSFYYATDSD